MRAAFTKAIHYQVHAVCVTPLRTAGADADTESVLRDRQGRAMIQGSSVAGALRGWLETRDPKNVLPLFGSQETPGALIVSDGLFAPGTECSVRPRLRIDGASGTADMGGKFDVMHINAGSAFDFTLTWLGHASDTEGPEAVESSLAALNAGQICFGAQKTNGFGRVSLQVNRRVFRMEDPGDRDAWLSDANDGKPFLLPAVAPGDSVVFTLRGTVSSLLVKSGQAESTSAGSYTPNLSEGGKSLLPGSSVKGAVRARAELIADTLGLDKGMTERVFGVAAMSGEEESLPGRVRFEDIVLDEKKQKITRIRINKFTGGVMRGGLFTEEPLSSAVTLRVTVPSDCPEGCGLILYALRDLGLGLYQLGSGGSIGRGFLQAQELRAETPDGRSLTIRFSKDGCKAEDPNRLAAEWRSAWEVSA